MRRIVIIFFFLFSFKISNTNPVMTGVYIYEILFESPNEWALEFVEPYYAFGILNYMDSIRIETISGSATVQFLDTTIFNVITNNNLKNPIYLNKEMDIIKLVSYSFGSLFVDSIIVGDIPGSYLHNIQYGQSISRYFIDGPSFKTNNPTIGEVNSFLGATGKIYGYFYDLDNEILSNKYFYINEGYSREIQQAQGLSGQTNIDDFGFYCAEITSRSYSISKIRIFESPSQTELFLIFPVNIEVNEDDSIKIDFRITISSIENNSLHKVLLNNYPNPAKEFTYFIVDQNINPPSNLNISIFDINGKKIDSFPIFSNKLRYDCSWLSQGVYICTLFSNDRILTTKKLIVVK